MQACRGAPGERAGVAGSLRPAPGLIGLMLQGGAIAGRYSCALGSARVQGASLPGRPQVGRKMPVRLRFVSAAVSLAALSWTLAACSDDATTTLSGSAAADAATNSGDLAAQWADDAASATACDQLAAAYCARLQACLPHDMAIDYADPALCRVREQLRCTAGLTAADANPSTAAIAASIAQMTAGSCDLIGYGGPPRTWFLPGKRPTGTACSVDTQCSGRLCLRSAGAACGACGSVVPLGEVCTNGACVAGAVCVFDAVQKSYRCRAKEKEGGPCNDNIKYASTCGWGLTCASGKCVPALALGEKCLGSGCNHALGLDCDSSKGVCSAIAMVGDGKSCDVGGLAATPLVECLDGACVNQNDMGMGTCRAYAADGAACNGWSGPACRIPARCVQGTCQVIATCP